MMVLGATGWVGSAVAERARVEDWQLVATSASGRNGSQRLDVRDRKAVGRLIDEVRPDTVVNAVLAGRSDVDRDAAIGLANEVAGRALRLVHVSTDCVHGGRETPYLDDEPANPCDWTYAQDKSAAEHAILALGADSVLVRSGMVVGDGLPGKHDHFNQTYLIDCVRQPVAVTDLAALLVELSGHDLVGTLHAAGPQEVTRLEYARALARRAGADPEAVRGTTMEHLDVDRPGVLRLDTSTASLLRTRLRPVGEVLES